MSGDDPGRVRTLVSDRSRMPGIGLAASIGVAMKVLNPPAPLQVSLTSASPPTVWRSPESL
jgi:hypothetical protein